MKTEPEDIPEPDRVPGAPHPRHTDRVIGQDNAIAEFMEAAQGGRLHHAWLLTGPRGVGKATLAWAIARWMLSGASGPFGATDTPEARRVAALSEPRLHLVRRPWDDKAGRLSAQITVDEIRRLLSFFHLSAAEGGRRVAIIDAADDMNLAAANALLKVLEEPPADALILKIAHQPAGLLPTIRSRCRTLRLSPLTPAQMGNVLAHLGIDEDAEALAALPRPPLMVLGFDCILRRLALEREGLRDQMSELLTRYRVAGFNTYGEQHSGMHVNQTFVGLAFMPNANAAPDAA